MMTLLALTLLLLPTASAQETVVVEGEHFRLHAHGISKECTERAAEIVEAVWEPTQHWIQGKAEEGAELLDVHLYADLKDYLATDLRLTEGLFQRNQAFAHYDSLSAHVALQPWRSPALIEELGLPRQTEVFLAHEAAHLVRYSTVRNERSHPHWLADGLASSVELQVLQQERGVGDLVEHPFFARHVVHAQQLAEAGRLPSVQDVLSDKIDELQFYERYAVRYCVFEFLTQQHARPMRRWIGELRSIGGGTGFMEKAQERFEKHFSKTARKKLDAQLAAWLGRLEPRWEELHRSLEVHAEEWVQCAFAKTNAMAWRLTEPLEVDCTLEGEVRIEAGEKQQLNLLLARRAEGFLVVAFVADKGVNLMRYTSAGNRWENLAWAELEGLKSSTWHSFRVQGEQGRVRITVDGQECLDTELAQLSLAGPWGVGARAGSTGRWRGIR